VVQKVRTGLVFASNFVKSKPICQILTLRERGRNFQREPHNISLHLKLVAALSCEITDMFKYDANREENENKMI